VLNLVQFDKEVIVNGVRYESVSKALEALKDHAGSVEILLNSKKSTAKKADQTKKEKKIIYRVVVKKYMTEKSSPGFDFMLKYNNDNPMPLRTMYGEIIEETKGMFKMKLHGRAEKNAVRCSHCMRELTHPVSRIYGIGPFCGGHFWQANEWIKQLANNEEALFREADRRMRQITWEGWIIKSAITSMEEVES
jgi:hypothetical protein